MCLALANIGYFLWMQGIGQSQAVPAAAPPGASLKLASEAAATPAPGGDVADAGSGAGAAAGAPGGEKRCVSVGPFREVSEAAHAASTLRSGGYDPRQRVVDGEVWAGVWVYLPLPATHPESDQLLAKLKAAGIDDSLLMPGPGAEGSVISLGLYSEPKRAQARVAQLSALGLTADVADRKRNGNLYWIDIDLKPTDGAFDASALQGEAGHINRLEVRPCAPPQAVS